MLDVARHGQRPRLKSWKSSLGVEASQESTPTPPRSRQHLDSSTSTYLKLTHHHLDKSTSTYFRLIIIVFISRRRLIPPLNECSTKKAPGYALDVDLFRLIRLIFMFQIDLSLKDTNSRQRRISNLSIVGEDSMLKRS